MSKISDRELEQLENEDLEVPVQRFKKKSKIVRPEKYPNNKKKKIKREKIDWNELDKEDY